VLTMPEGKYRYRTMLREHVPGLIAARIPKGKNDCGDHEWYLDEPRTWRCYHCEVGVSHELPWDPQEVLARHLEGQAMNARAGLAGDRQHIHH
jgi:hypothetical protein